MSDYSVSNEFLASLLINEEIEQPKQAIDANSIVRVKILMMRNPLMHRALLG